MSSIHEEMEKVFNDAVHGAISIPSLCVSVIDTPQFQRLRFLKQLGSTCYVYPSAAHNRFEHGLGVCHLAGQLVKALQSRQPELEITDKDVLCVMLAGLCHDLGHGPFSHMWESFVSRARPNTSWKHEEASVKLFDHMLKENPHLIDEFRKHKLDEEDVTFIKELIDGPKKLTEGWPYEGRPKEKAFLYEVVANKRTGVDVDKWDYILRDGHSLGIKVTFVYDRIVQFSRVIDGLGEGEWPQICVRDKECNNLYDMFHARFLLHRSAYQHRVVQTIDAMLIDAFLCADRHIQYPGTNGVKLALADVCTDMVAFTHLTDEVFHRILLADGSHPELTKAKLILNNILARKLYPYVGCTQPSADKVDAKKLMSALESNIPEGSVLSREELLINQVKLNYGMGDKNPMEHVRFYTKYSPNLQKVIRKEEVSAMLPQNFQETFFRVLCKSNDEQDLFHAQEALTAACKDLNLKAQLVDSWPSILTPVKPGTSQTTSVPAKSTAAKQISFES